VFDGSDVQVKVARKMFRLGVGGAATRRVGEGARAMHSTCRVAITLVIPDSNNKEHQ
jgi:hypothetical protein